MYNAPAKISAHWFPRHERIISTSVMSAANLVGIGFGYIIPDFFFSARDGESITFAKTDTYRLLHFEAIFATVIFIVSLFFFKSYPIGRGRNMNMSQESNYSSNQLFNDLKISLKNKGFMLTSFGTACKISYFCVYQTLLEQMIFIYGFDVSKASYLGLMYDLFGIFGALSISWII